MYAYNPKAWDAERLLSTAANTGSKDAYAADSGMSAAVPGESRLLPAPERRRHPVRWEAALWVAGVVVLGSALALPWWSETVRYGPIDQGQTFSPWNGVTVTCAPSCGSYAFSTEASPGVKSFGSFGLVDTALLYEASLGLLLVAMVAAGISAAQLRSLGGFARRTRLGHLERVPSLLSVVASVVGASILPLLQPFAMRQDLIVRFFGVSQWTASPSPESSFWGACDPGPYSGLCASGGSATWGPGFGWWLMVVGVGLLLAALTQRGRRLT